MRSPIRKLPMYLVVLGVLLALSAPGSLQAGKKDADRSGKVITGVPTGYSFARYFKGRWPGYQTARITLRNPKKLRPLYLTGHNKEGKITLTFQDLGDLESMAEDVEMAAFLDYAKCVGSYTVRLDTYSAADCDLERFVGTEWLKQEERPAIEVDIKKISNWVRPEKVVKNNKTGVVESTQHGVKVTGSIRVGDKSHPFTTVARATLWEPAEGSPAKLFVRFRMKVKGSDLGLTGDDAGELDMYFASCGFADHRTTDVKLPTSGAPDKPEIDLGDLD